MISHYLRHTKWCNSKCKLIAIARACKAQIYFSPSRMKTKLFMITKTFLKLIFHLESSQRIFYAFDSSSEWRNKKLLFVTFHHSTVVELLMMVARRDVTNSKTISSAHPSLSSCSDSEAWKNCLKFAMKLFIEDENVAKAAIVIHSSRYTLLYFFRSLNVRRSLAFRAFFALPRSTNKTHNLSGPFIIRFARFSTVAFSPSIWRCFGPCFQLKINALNRAALCAACK